MVDVGTEARCYSREASRRNANMTTKTQPVIVPYLFADLGRVDIALHNEAASLYRYLDDDKQIARLGELDHLGPLRDVLPGAYHSRLEYVMLQLYPVDRLKSAGVPWGLSQGIVLDGNRVSSVSELIKYWILLLNTSHLKGIFEAERFWLSLLCQSEVAREGFLRALPTEYSRRAAAETIGREDFYALHQFIGLALLAGHARKMRQQGWPFSLWISMIEAYLRGGQPGSPIALAKHVFRRVRTFGCTCLDLAHSHLGLRFDIHRALQQLTSDPEQLFGADEAPLDRQIEAAQRMLLSDVFATPEAVCHRVHYAARQKAGYASQASRAPLSAEEGTHRFWGSIWRIRERLRGAMRNDFGRPPRVNPHCHFLRLEFWPDEVFESEPVRCLSLERELRVSQRDPGWEFVVTPTAFAGRSAYFLDVCRTVEPTAREVRRLIWTLSQHVSHHFQEQVRDFDSVQLERELGALPWRQLFGKVLEQFLLPGVTARLHHPSSPESFSVDYVRSSGDRRAWSRRVLAATKDSVPDAGRAWELDCLRRLVRDETRGQILVALCRVQMYDEQRRSIGDLDGVYFRITARSVEMAVLEAKRGIRWTSEKARGSLATTLKRSFGVDGTSIGRKKGMAFARLPLGSCGPWSP